MCRLHRQLSAQSPLRDPLLYTHAFSFTRSRRHFVAECSPVSVHLMLLYKPIPPRLLPLCSCSDVTTRTARAARCVSREKHKPRVFVLYTPPVPYGAGTLSLFTALKYTRVTFAGCVCVFWSRPGPAALPGAWVLEQSRRGREPLGPPVLGLRKTRTAVG